MLVPVTAFEGIVLSDYVENVVSCGAGEPAVHLDGGAGAAVVKDVPGALALALLGIVCVALVRDGRTWAWLVAAAYSLTEQGALLLPRLVAAAAASRIVECPSGVSAVPALRAFAGRGRAAETRFAGLLRRLEAEPASQIAVLDALMVIRQMLPAACGVRAVQAAFCVAAAGESAFRAGTLSRPHESRYVRGERAW